MAHLVMIAPHFHLAFLVSRRSDWCIPYSTLITATMGALSLFSLFTVFSNASLGLYIVGSPVVLFFDGLNWLTIYRGLKR